MCRHGVGGVDNVGVPGEEASSFFLGLFFYFIFYFSFFFFSLSFFFLSIGRRMKSR